MTRQVRQVRITLLDTPSLEVAGVPVDLGRTLNWCLFARLAVEEGRQLTLRTLRWALWGREEADRKALEKPASEIRKALTGAGLDGNAMLPRGNDGYRLLVPADATVDLYRYREANKRGRALERADPAGAARLLGEALAWWRGDPLAGLSSFPWAEGYQRALDEEKRKTQIALFKVRLALGHGGDLIPDLSGLCQIYPDDGQIRQLLARAYFQADRVAEARRTDRRFDPEQERQLMKKADQRLAEVVPLPVESGADEEPPEELAPEPARQPAAPAAETPRIVANRNIFQDKVEIHGDWNQGWLADS
jgi:DNA-binding SARP family transcriptional activator